MQVEPLSLIDTTAYPIAARGDGRLEEVMASARAQLRESGCAILPGFIKQSALQVLRDEVRTLSAHAYFSRAQATVYGREPDMEFPAGHPRSRILQRHNGFVAGDVITGDTSLRSLYHSEDLKALLAGCLGVPRVYEFADPLAQLVINVVKPEEHHAWHFDSNEFVVTIMTQQADAGGEFEYVPNIRSAGNENYEAVQSVLDGSRSGVRILELHPGDMQLFLGRYSMHRVRQAKGCSDRHTVVLSYTKEPGILGKAAKTATIYGRKLSVHDSVQNAGSRDDALTD